MLALLASAAMLSGNWLAFIYSIETHQLSQAALGYYIIPLVTVFLASIILREQLRAVQWVCVGLAAVGVGLNIYARGGVSWIPLTIAFSFATYGLLRKQIAVSPIVGLAFETALLSPAAMAYFAWPAAQTTPHALGTIGMLAVSGVVTATPLLLFAKAARSLRLSTLGFLQYIAPSIQFLIAVIVWHEPINRLRFAGFLPIWLGVAIFTIDSARRLGGNSASAPMTDSPNAEPRSPADTLPAL